MHVAHEQEWILKGRRTNVPPCRHTCYSIYPSKLPYIRNTQRASEKVGDDKDRCPNERTPVSALAVCGFVQIVFMLFSPLVRRTLVGREFIALFSVIYVPKSCGRPAGQPVRRANNVTARIPWIRYWNIERCCCVLWYCHTRTFDGQYRHRHAGQFDCSFRSVRNETMFAKFEIDDVQS